MSAEEVIDDALAAIEKVRAAVPMVSDFLGPKGTFASRLISWSLGALFEGLSEIRTTRTTETFEEVRARYAAKVTFEATELEVGAVQVAGGALVGALVGGFVRHPMLGALVGGAAGAAALRTPVTIWIALQLQKAGLLYLPPAPATGAA